VATVLVPLAQGCEELEAVTIIDLLRRAGVEVITASLQPGPVQCSRGTVLIADTELQHIMNQTFDMIVLPGGLPGADHLRDDIHVQELLKTMAAAGKYTAAICAAPKALAAAGLLNDRKATAYPGVLESLSLPSTKITTSAIEDDDKIVTSRGPGTAMDFALYLIEKLKGEPKRIEVETALQR
jgi:4-methyl-5(b-hydroxyethyl)-thiazole monophosphate biosynthesis